MEEKKRSGDEDETVDRGRTRIDKGVLVKITRYAAEEIDGVRVLAESAAARTVRRKAAAPPVDVVVEDGSASVSLSLAVQYGRSIPQLMEAVRRNVRGRLENLVGLDVASIDVAVDDVFFEEVTATGPRTRIH